MSQKIIVLGGVHGVGKTTLAHELSKRFSVKSVICIGPIIAALKQIECANPLLGKIRAYDQIVYESEIATPKEFEEKFIAKCEAVGKVISTIISYQVGMGASCIIEGTELLPQFLPISDIKFFMITNPDEERLRAQLERPSGSRTKQPAKLGIDKILQLQNLLAANAQKYQIPIIKNSADLNRSLEEIAQFIET